MAHSTGERIAHVFRRLGMGAHPDLLPGTTSVEAAIQRALDLEHPSPELMEMDAPLDRETATDIARLAGPVQWWLESMITSGRLIEERLVWFWHDHFATAIQKVRIPYLLWQQHLTIRSHATGSFRDLLHAISTDPAMLFYLDGARNHADQINENHARELMELHTMGTGQYDQKDVEEAAKALTGWVVNVPYGRGAEYLTDYEPWTAVYVPFRHYPGNTTILGSTADHSPSDLIDLLLEQSATAEFVTASLWAELVGTEPDRSTVASIAATFRQDYSIMQLATAIADHPEFTSEEAIRAKVRTPVERLVSIGQGFGDGAVAERLGYSLHEMAYLPFNPPSPAGYPRGRVLLGPHQLVHSFDLLDIGSPRDWSSTDEILARAGLVDVAEETRRVIELAPESATKVALATNSPEFALV